jgi:hypothetical protein
MENAMSDLTPEDRALLDLARAGHEPTQTDRSRVRAALVASLGVGAGLTVTTTASSAAGASILAKVLAAVVVAAAVGGGSFVSYRALQGSGAAQHRGAAGVATAVEASPARVPSSAVVVASVDPPRAEPRGVEPGAPPVTPESAHESRPIASNFAAPRVRAPVSSPASAASVPASRSAAETAATVADTAAAVGAPLAVDPAAAPASVASGPAFAQETSPSVEHELSLIRAGVAALHAGDALKALSLFDQHERQFPNGVVSEERDAERVLALCALRRVAEAQVAASDFLRTHAQSVLALRVRESCAGPSNP